jgi:hypothetical protein
MFMIKNIRDRWSRITICPENAAKCDLRFARLAANLRSSLAICHRGEITGKVFLFTRSSCPYVTVTHAVTLAVNTNR